MSFFGYNASMAKAISRETVRTRIAPSPTGSPHIGTVYQALFNFAWARRNRGNFIVRIEDTDRERFVEGAEGKIFEALDFFFLREDESPRKRGGYGPYRQSERLKIYQKYAEELVEKGGAYYCFCTKERLEELRKKQTEEKKPTMYDKHCLNLSKEEIKEKLGGVYVVRLKVPENKTISVKDEIRGFINFDSNLIEDSVLVKSDGFPTYHFAVVVDDYLMKITHVLRGEEWLSSFPKHTLIYDYFGWKKPLFYHTPLLRNPDKSKLSKRQGHANVDWYKEEGFLPEAILNFLALLGWTHPEGKDEFSLYEFIDKFDVGEIRTVAPIFDLTKLEWLNGVWIRKYSLEKLKELLQNFYKGDKEIEEVFESKHIDLLIRLAQSRMKKLSEFKGLVISSKEREYTKEEMEISKILFEKLSALDIKDWREANILETLRNLKNENGISMKAIYFVITGREQGLPLIETMVRVEGRDEILKKLKEKSPQ